MRSMQKVGGVLAALLLVLSSGAAASPAGQEAGRRAPGLYARVSTEAGSFTFRLLENDVPKVVANFVGLAEGTIDPATGKPGKSKPFYDGLTFHRAVKGFIIQGGDPNGDGSGGPGYHITADASTDPTSRRFDRAGLVAMADSPSRIGSQFFVTLAPADWLNGKFAIFGEVVNGMDVVARIAAGRTQTLPGDRLAVPVRIDSVRIERVSD